MRRHRDSTIFSAGLSLLAVLAMLGGAWLVPVDASSNFEISTAAIKALQSLLRPGGLVGPPSSASAPATCGASNAGATYYDTAAGVVRTCDGTSWGAAQTTKAYSWTNAQIVGLGAALTGDITMVTLPAKSVVSNSYVVITGQAAGTTTLTVACGTVGAAYIDLIVASDAKAAANTVYGDASGERGTNSLLYFLPSYTATTAVKCHFIATGTNLDTVTGSAGTLFLTTQILP